MAYYRLIITLLKPFNNLFIRVIRSIRVIRGKILTPYSMRASSPEDRPNISSSYMHSAQAPGVG
jgi:hypothetical protein